jgi:hypothetical protein
VRTIEGLTLRMFAPCALAAHRDSRIVRIIILTSVSKSEVPSFDMLRDVGDPK